MNQPNLQIFHLLILLREIKHNDKLFLMKLYQNLCSPNLKSQFARCQLIRFIISLINSGDVEDNKTFTVRKIYFFLYKFLGVPKLFRKLLTKTPTGISYIRSSKGNYRNSTFQKYSFSYCNREP